MLKIHFYLRVNTQVGQTFSLELNTKNCIHEERYTMQYLNNKSWFIEVEVNTENLKYITYNYILYFNGNQQKSNRKELKIPLDKILIKVFDMWHNTDSRQVFYTKPFQYLFSINQKRQNSSKEINDYTHILKVKCPLLNYNERVCLLGSTDELKNWNTQNVLILDNEGEWYTIRLNLSNTNFPIEYKYGIWNIAENKFLSYEDGYNRILSNNQGDSITILHDGYARFDQKFYGAGVAIPVFSLRSKNSFGVGTFSDICLLADWGAMVGIKLIQLLPINDTTATNSFADSYPYSIISAFALHPIYIDIQKIAGRKYQKLIKPILKKLQQLNDLRTVNYEQVLKLKWKALRLLYEVIKEHLFNSKKYFKFYNNNKHWLLPYAAFCYLRNKYKTVDFTKWKKYSVFNSHEIERLISNKKYFDQIGIHLFIQYYLHLQLSEVVKYVHKKGIVIKGDLPIGVNRHSCDVWMYPDLFDTNEQVGAPPDDFAKTGQNWGFPAYNWKQMKDDDFRWWKSRLKQMSSYFDAYRIDHILGFFRIWCIPENAVEGVLGRFIPAISVHRSEFLAKGLKLNDKRYCQPYITNDILNNFFKEKADWVKHEFLENDEEGIYKFKREFNTQRKIEKWFNDQSAIEEQIKQPLFNLISNVLLFRDEDNEDAFHFRIDMQHTYSFQNLSVQEKDILINLYNDYFYYRQNDFWKQGALEKLPALKEATNMLICGEDLGMVPACVPNVMQKLNILSLEIQRMPKAVGNKFSSLAEVPYLSVVSPSTHDMSTIRGWWEEDRSLTQQFYNNELKQNGLAPFFCEPWINEKIVEQHLKSPAMWAIFQLQDLLGIDGDLRRQMPQEERINIPANSNHCWNYRVHINLEDLIEASAFNEKLKMLISQSER